MIFQDTVIKKIRYIRYYYNYLINLYRNIYIIFLLILLLYNMHKTKLILIGETQTGKTSIINRIIRNEFYEVVGSTLGKTQNDYKVELKDGQEVVFDVWDTAGQEKFRSLNKIFFKNAKIALLIYAVDSKKSFDTLKEWCNIVKEECNNQPSIIKNI